MGEVDYIRLKGFIWHYMYLAAMKIPLRCSKTHTSLQKQEVKILVVFGPAVVVVMVGSAEPVVFGTAVPPSWM